MGCAVALWRESLDQRDSFLLIEFRFEVFGGNCAIHIDLLNVQFDYAGRARVASVISGEFLDAFARRLVLNIKRSSLLLQVKLLIGDRSAGSRVLKLSVASTSSSTTRLSRIRDSWKRSKRK